MYSVINSKKKKTFEGTLHLLSVTCYSWPVPLEHIIQSSIRCCCWAKDGTVGSAPVVAAGGGENAPAPAAAAAAAPAPAPAPAPARAPATAAAAAPFPPAGAAPPPAPPRPPP